MTWRDSRIRHYEGDGCEAPYIRQDWSNEDVQQWINHQRDIQIYEDTLEKIVSDIEVIPAGQLTLPSPPPETFITIDGHMYVHVAACACHAACDDCGRLDGTHDPGVEH